MRWLTDPHKTRQLHRILALAWMFPGLPLAWAVTYLVPEPHAQFAILFVSLYANTAAHWSAYQATRAEEAQG